MLPLYHNSHTDFLYSDVIVLLIQLQYEYKNLINKSIYLPKKIIIRIGSRKPSIPPH